MLLDFVATVSAGLGLAGLVMIARWLLRGRLPGWLVPAAAGAGMLAFAIWNEYTWFPRTAAALPPGVTVARTVEESALWRPWTYWHPIVTRFSAVDLRTARTNPEAPGQVLATVLLIARWQPRSAVPVLFDCDSARQAPLLGPDPFAEPIPWEAVPPDDDVLRAACVALD